TPSRYSGFPSCAPVPARPASRSISASSSQCPFLVKICNARKDRKSGFLISSNPERKPVFTAVGREAISEKNRVVSLGIRSPSGVKVNHSGKSSLYLSAISKLLASCPPKKNTGKCLDLKFLNPLASAWLNSTAAFSKSSCPTKILAAMEWKKPAELGN